MIDRKDQTARQWPGTEADEDMATATLDSSELSRLAAEVARRQTADDLLDGKPAAGIIKSNLPYLALILTAGLAAFTYYQAHIVPVAMPVPVTTVAPPTAADQAATLPDKLRQISNCETESMRTYPNQGDVRALQFYNMCMTGAGFTPNYACDTTLGIPAYNPSCWIPGKNM